MKISALKWSHLIGTEGIAILLVLGKYMDKEGKSAPSIRTIEKETSLCKATVITRLKLMEDLGIISKERRLEPGKGNFINNQYELINT